VSEESALGGVSLAVDIIHTGWEPKLSSVKPGSVEGFYMLATFVFDLSRKLEYVFKATKEFAPRADSTLAREIKQDNATLRAHGQNWEAAAKEAEKIMLRLQTAIRGEAEQLLNQAAAGGR